MIKTSYFSSRKYDPKEGISISLYAPFWKGPTCKELCPTKQILAWWKSLTQEEQKSIKYQSIYERLYRRDVLAHLNVHEFYQKLNNKTLLCFEKTGDFCHRHIVAKWFNENGYNASEI